MTNENQSSIIIERLGNTQDAAGFFRKNLKKVEKTFKKGLTNRKECAIIIKLSTRETSKDEHRSLKIEQQNFEQNMQVLNKCV